MVLLGFEKDYPNGRWGIKTDHNTSYYNSDYGIYAYLNLGFSCKTVDDIINQKYIYLLRIKNINNFLLFFNTIVISPKVRQDIEAGLATCKEELGEWREKLDQFFDTRDFYNDDER